jgi:hypothetical protein
MKKLSILLFFLPLTVLAQEQDFQLWSKLDLGYKLNDKFSVDLSEGFRLRENASLPIKTFTNVSLNYRYFKQLRLAGGYRFIQVFDLAQEVNLRHRYYIDVVLKEKKKRWRVSYRARFQQQEGVNHSEGYHRSKLSTSYNVRKTPLAPSASIEGFYDFKNKTVDKIRCTLGVSHPLSKQLEADIYYRIQNEMNVNAPNTFYILGFGLSYSL